MVFIYLVLLLTLIVVAILVFRKNRTKQIFKFRVNDTYDLKAISITDIDMMEDGSGFEEYLLRLLLALGYSDTYKTVASHDFGADLVFTDSKGFRTIIQAKRYSIDSFISIDAVQQVYTAKNYYQAKKTMVIGTTKYRDSTDKLAAVNAVLLLDRDDLINIIEAFKSNDYGKAKDIIEREPRIEYEVWDNKEKTFQIKRDKKMDKILSEEITM